MNSLPIPGAYYLRNFISPVQQSQLIVLLNDNNHPWNDTLKRKTQHYGYQYNYKSRSLRKLEIGLPVEIEPYVHKLEQMLMENVVFQEHPEMPIHFDQLIVNQYEPGQGIESHIDKPALFEGIIASISLGSDCFMEFQKEKEQPQQVYLQRRSVLVLTGDARWIWKHGIRGVKKDRNGVSRGTRYSLTFRKVKPQAISFS